LHLPLVVASCVVSIVTGLVITRKTAPAADSGAKRAPRIDLSPDTLK
jgi:hypothetical protein